MKAKFVDTHAHVNFPEYDGDREETIRRALDGGVAMINVGTDQESSKRAVELAEKYPEGIYAIIGHHPTSEEDFDVDFYRNLAKSKKVVGIGECGLDFFRTEDKDAREKQSSAFRGQIELALMLDLPLMIHCRDAYKETLSILDEYKKSHGEKVKGNFHFFAGSIEVAQKILDLGFTMSFTGVVTFTNDYDQVIKFLPLDKILSETDCPYVSPLPYRGKRNEPLYIREVVSKIAEIKNISETECQRQLFENACRLFKIC